MEIPKVVGGIFEVYSVDEASVIWCFASGMIICLVFLGIYFLMELAVQFKAL